MRIIHLSCAHCLHKVTVTCILTCRPEPQSRQDNQSQFIKTDLQFAFFWSVFTRIWKRSTSRRRFAPVPAIIQGDVEFDKGPLEEEVHPHLLVAAPERPALDKLSTKEVFDPDIKASEDLNLRPVAASPTAFGSLRLRVPVAAARAASAVECGNDSYKADRILRWTEATRREQLETSGCDSRADSRQVSCESISRLNVL